MPWYPHWRPSSKSGDRKLANFIGLISRWQGDFQMVTKKTALASILLKLNIKWLTTDILQVLIHDVVQLAFKGLPVLLQRVAASFCWSCHRNSPNSRSHVHHALPVGMAAALDVTQRLLLADASDVFSAPPPGARLCNLALVVSLGMSPASQMKWRSRG